MPDLQHTYCGAPATLWLSVRVNADASVSLEQAFNKTATRLGEAHFALFLPVPQAGDYVWKMGSAPTEDHERIEHQALGSERYYSRSI
jgi:hypothetical protein